MAEAWALSRRFDTLGFVMPIFVAFLLVPLTRSVPDSEVPLIYYVPLVMMVDVAHVYGTLLRTVFDSEATAANFSIFVKAPVFLFIITFLIIVIGGEELAWTLLAYFAIFHFMKQPFGILCLFKARMGDFDPSQHRIDYWTCMTGALCPVLLDHCRLRATVCDRDFCLPLVRADDEYMKWFNNGEKYLFRLPAAARSPIWVIYAVVPLLWLANICRRRFHGCRFNPGKVWIMLVQYVSWYVGVVGKHEVRALAFVNLFHGVSSMVLVYVVVQRRYATLRAKRPESMCWRDRLCETLVSSPWVYIIFMVVLGVLEDGAWEVFFYQRYLPDMGYRLPKIDGLERALVMALFMQPQLIHYFLDAYIWRMVPRNPGLREAILGTTEKQT